MWTSPHDLSSPSANHSLFRNLFKSPTLILPFQWLLLKFLEFVRVQTRSFFRVSGMEIKRPTTILIYFIDLMDRSITTWLYSLFISFSSFSFSLYFSFSFFTLGRLHCANIEWLISSNQQCINQTWS